MADLSAFGALVRDALQNLLGNDRLPAAAIRDLPDGAVTSVNGAQGAVTIGIRDLGGAPAANPVFTGTVQGVTKAHVGLGKADNTRDMEKPISTAVANAIAPLIAHTPSRTYASVAEMLAGRDTLAAGQRVAAGGHRYTVAAAAASDHHLTTAGGAKLHVQEIGSGRHALAAFGAPMDGIGDDAPALQKAIDATRDHGTLELPPRLRLASPVTLPTNRNLRLIGAPTRIRHADVQCFRILNVNSGDTGRHLFDGLSFQAETAFTGTPFYLENASGQAFRNMKFFRPHTIFDVHNNLAGSWSEGLLFENIEATGFVYGWRYRRTLGDASFSDQHFIRCKISVNSSADPGVQTFGLHIGAGCSLYRSFFGNLTIFPSVDNAVGVHINGNIHNASGAINIESTDVVTGAVGIQLGPNASSSSHFVVFDVVGASITPFSQDPASTAHFVVPCTQASNRNGGRWVAPHVAVVLESITRPDDNAEVWRETLMTNDRRKIEAAQPVEFADFNGDTQRIKAIPIGNSVTIAAGPRPSFANLSDATFSYKAAETVTAFQGGLPGQEVVCVFSNGNTTLAHSANLRLKGAVDYTPANTDVLTFRCSATGIWREVARLAA